MDGAQRAQVAVAYAVVACGSSAFLCLLAAILGPSPLTTTTALAVAATALIVPLMAAVARKNERVDIAPDPSKRGAGAWLGGLSSRTAMISLAAAGLLGSILAALARAPGLVAAPVACALLELVVTPRLLAWLPRPGLLGNVLATSPARRLWLVLAALGLLQVTHLSAFMMAPSFRAGSAMPFYGATHACLAAYLRGAELAHDDASGLYDNARYAHSSPEKPNHTSIADMEPYLSDPYHYPPPFLVLPRVALTLSNSFFRLRTAWYGAALLALLALTVWIAVRSGRPATLPLTAAVLASFPTLYNLQFGQVHFLVIAAAVAGILALHDRRYLLGGTLLAASILVKLFPGIVLVYLAARREWRAVAVTAGAAVALIVVSLIILGPEPMLAFADGQLGRLLGGDAFAQFAGDDEFVVGNIGMGSLGFKLEALGSLPGALAIGRGVGLVYLVAMGALAAFLARRDHAISATDEPPLVAVTGLLVLASLVGTFAPSSYVTAPALWLLALALPARAQAASPSASPGARTTRRDVLVWAALWLFLQTVPIFSSLPVFWRMPALHVPMGLLGQLVLVAVTVMLTLSRSSRRSGSEMAS